MIINNKNKLEMEFENFDDLFKWNKNLMEDDWNDGQHLVIKAKNKGPGCEFATSLKVGEAGSDGSHKVSAEEKVKIKMSEWGGNEVECKIKNNGTVSYQWENNSLQVSHQNMFTNFYFVGV